MGNIKELDKATVIAIYNAIREKKADWPGTWETCDIIHSYALPLIPASLLIKFKDNRDEKWELEKQYESIWLKQDKETNKCSVEFNTKEFTSFDPDLGWGSTIIGMTVTTEFPTFEDAITYIYNHMLIN